MQNKWFCRLIFVFVIVFLIFGMPLLINESYKCDTIIYITKWNAEDVLAYYGVILGSIVTVGVLAATIAFTKKQIQRESFVIAETEKWAKLEHLFAKVLDAINPMRPMHEILGKSLEDPGASAAIIRTYSLRCLVAVDQLDMHLNAQDLPKVTSLIKAIKKAGDSFAILYKEELDIYLILRNFSALDDMIGLLKTEAQHPGSFSPKEIATAQSLVDKIGGKTEDDFINQIIEINERITQAYHKAYRPLLQEKNKVFEQINAEIDKDANSILHLWGKK